MRIFLLSALLAGSCFGQMFGTWKMVRSTSSGGAQPKNLTMRIEQHLKGEVLTVDRVEPDGRTTSSSSILYLDGTPRDFQDFGCSGTQWSRRVDSRTVEVVRMCGANEWTRLVRRTSPKPNELVLEVTEQHADGRRFEHRLTLERQ